MSEGRGSSFPGKSTPIPADGKGDISRERATPSPVARHLDEAPTAIHSASEILGGSASVLEQIAGKHELLGEKLEHFELLDCIGAGGMGRVYRARDTRLERLVALKVLSPELTKDEDIRRRFEQEAKASARLDDIHFARAYYFGESNGVPFIAMEYVDGENLRQMLVRRGRLDYRLVLNIGLQIVRGLAHAAACGVVHRDIKPSNIIVTPSGIAKLVDMGLARNFFQTSSQSSELTRYGVTLGTFDYISPEQARDPREADIRSDIYSLGCTLYHSLTERPPFPEGSALQKLLQHQADPVPDPRHFAPEIPEGLVAILLKMMAKDPADRYQAPEDLIEDLSRLCGELDVVVPTEAGLPGQRAELLPFWERQLYWLAPCVLFLVAIGGFAWWDRPRGNELLAAADPWNRPRAAEGRPTETVASKPTSPPIPPPASSPRPGLGVVRSIVPGANLRQEIERCNRGDTLELAAGTFLVSPGDLLFKGLLLDKDISIRGKGVDQTELVLQEDRAVAGAPALFRVVSGQCEVARMRLTFATAPSSNRPSPLVTVSGGAVEFVDCAFNLPKGTSPSLGSAVEIERGEAGSVPRFVGTRCYFAVGEGNDVLRAGEGPASVTLTDCVFQPARHAFVLGPRIELTLAHCSVLAGPGAVFQFARLDSEARIVVSDCIFSRRGTALEPLIASARDDRPARDWWTGKNNLYHGWQDGPVLIAGRSRVATLDELERLWSIRERDSRIIAENESPWQSPDADSDAEQLENPGVGFRLAAALTSASGGTEAVGARATPWGSLYPKNNLPPAIEKRSVAKTPEDTPPVFGPKPPVANPTGPAAPPTVDTPSLLAVDPRVPAGAEKGVYRNLPSACDDAATGSTIELRTDETIPIRDIKLATGKELTIRSAAGFHPRLTLAPATAGRPEPARLFQVAAEAKLRLSGVAVEIESGPVEVDAGPAIVFDCDERSSVELRSLWVLLGRKSRSPSVVLAQVHGPAAGASGMPGMPIAGGAARLHVERCEVRARGSLVAADPAALWQIVTHESFLACEEPAIDIRGNPLMVSDAVASQVEARRGTFLLREGLISIQATSDPPRPPRRIEVKADSTAFVGIGTNAPLARITGNIPVPQQLDAIRWEGVNNLVSGFPTLLQHGADSSGGLPVNLSPEAWARHYELSDQQYALGLAEIPELRAASLWEQPIPGLAALRRLRWPADRGDQIGAPTDLPERAPLSPINY